MGLAGESGEVVDEIKKHLFHGKPLDMETTKEELSDVFWYLVGMCLLLGFEVEEVLQTGVDKVDKRYPNGFESRYK